MTNIILPFDEDTLWNIIESGDIENTTYRVNVLQSYANLNDSLLYYISNLNLKVELDWEGCTGEIKRNIVQQYVNMNRVFDNRELNETLGSVLLTYKQLAHDPNTLLDYENTLIFIRQNEQLIEQCVQFMDSILLYMNYQLTNHNKTFDKSKYETVTTNAIPVNLVNLFHVAMFGLYYTKVDETKMEWYESQFTLPLFNNECLFAHVFAKDSFLAIIGNSFNDVSSN